ncbi:MAG: GTP 3',8-cyclase MoaA [Myxococcales bacterium]|nr:GTP 3',8-cyclase MoaA [Myxococcales bacterium]
MSGTVPLGALSLAGPHEPRRQGGAPSPFSLVDFQRRTVRYVRISLTDRCNFRCTYCMPAEGVEVVQRPDLLRFEEIVRLVRVFVSMGINRVRLTGGEPLTRRRVVDLIGQIAAIDGLEDLAMTTNGHLLPSLAAPLRAAGLTRLNVSLDTLDADNFARITRQGDLSSVIAGLDAAKEAGFSDIKLNAVMLRGMNDAEAPDLLAYARDSGFTLRFIEYMPIGTDDFWGPKSFISGGELRDILLKAGWTLRLDEGSDAKGGGPARYWAAWPRGVDPASEPGTPVGFITAVSDHFCATCNRVRVSPVGILRECLSTPGALSLRDAMRHGDDDAALAASIRDALDGKVDGHRFEAGQQTFESMVQIGG